MPYMWLEMIFQSLIICTQCEIQFIPLANIQDLANYVHEGTTEHRANLIDKDFIVILLARLIALKLHYYIIILY